MLFQKAGEQVARILVQCVPRLLETLDPPLFLEVVADVRDEADGVLEDPSNVADISALVNKFRSQAGAPIKTRALLAGVKPNGVVDFTPDVEFTHITAFVDAFKGKPYPYTIASCP